MIISSVPFMDKKIPFLLLLFLCIHCSMHAQSYVGAFVGFNNSKLSGDEPYQARYKNLPGLNVGGIFDVQLHKGVFLSFQPSFSQEGTKVLYNVSGFPELVDSMRLKLNYFALPVLLKINSTNKRFYALTGVEMGYLIKTAYSNGGVEQDLDLDIKEWNVAMHFGAGMYIPIGITRLFVELRYTQGLRNITDDPLDSNIIPRVKTQGLKVLTGIQIPLKRTEN